ncbi:hypothetical protein MRX96_003946 [Rhipicephalus microplus]
MSKEGLLVTESEEWHRESTTRGPTGLRHVVDSVQGGRRGRSARARQRASGMGKAGSSRVVTCYSRPQESTLRGPSRSSPRSERECVAARHPALRSATPPLPAALFLPIARAQVPPILPFPLWPRKSANPGSEDFLGEPLAIERRRESEPAPCL